MYFKVTNIDSEVYKKLHAQRTLELQYEEENKQAIQERIGSDWKRFFGNGGQSSMNRVTSYSGFEFNNPEKLDSKTWKAHKEHPTLYVPNRRTKKGRELDQFLTNGLKGSFFIKIFEIIGFEDYHGSFRMPYLEIEGDTILLYIDNRFEPTDNNIVEITKKEFNTIRGTVIA